MLIAKLRFSTLTLVPTKKSYNLSLCGIPFSGGWVVRVIVKTDCLRLSYLSFFFSLLETTGPDLVPRAFSYDGFSGSIRLYI